MSGKSYTMKEMKAIVEYLTEHRAYSEIKGRKMWMDLASSKITNRTWQSLKETFLKRILPDIHNPYYKLTITQISSFRQGQDIEAKLNNRLQIRSTSQNSDTEGLKEKDAENPGNSNNNGNIEDEIAGEDPKQSHLRASTETLVLENCYETADDIRKDLQSPTDHTNQEEEAPPTKSMRELITYSEPLTPMLQSVIDYFVTDDEEREPQMQIVEPEDTKMINDQTQCDTQDNGTIEISDSEGNDIRNETNQILTKTSGNDRPSPIQRNENKHTEVVSQAKEAKTNNKDLATLSNESNETNNEENNTNKTAGDEEKSTSETTQNTSTNIADSLLPGNQEAFEKNKPPPQRSNLSLNKNTTLRSGRKRASSQDVKPKTKKRILSKLKSTSDTEKSNTSSKNILINTNLSTATQNLPEESNQLSSNVNNEVSESMPIHEEVTENLQNNANENPTGIENPCLKNVSLYAEQFSNEKYTDSDVSNTEDDRNKKGKNEKSDSDVSNTGKNEKSDDKNKKEVDENKTSENENNKTVGQEEDKNDKEKNKRGEDTFQETCNEKNKIKIAENKKTAEKSEDSALDKNKNRDNKSENLHYKHKKDDKLGSTTNKTTVQDNDNDIVMLELHSDSASNSHMDQVRQTRERSVKKQRDRQLANMFGFASGDTSRRQRIGTDCRKRTISHSRHRSKYASDSSGSSDWTSDTGSEYVSPPPRKYRRKGKHTRKYLKPRSVPILSLEEEGGLFVMNGKKIYPIVKDGKIVKSYLSYMSEDEVDTEESFWKLKYVEEKKKTAELTKLLNQAGRGKQAEVIHVPESPSTTQNDKAVAVSSNSREPIKTVPSIETSGAPKPVKEPSPTEDKKTVKLKFTKKDGEIIDIEGPWSALNPMLQHVAQLCTSGAEQHAAQPPLSRATSAADRPASTDHADEKSGNSTPIEEVQKKINQKEQEIYKEIEKYHEEEIEASDQPPEALNVTKRRGRQRKISPAVPPSPAAKRSKPNEISDQDISADPPAQPSRVENTTAATRHRRGRTSRKLLAETVENQNRGGVRPRKSTPKIPKETTDDAKQTDTNDLDEVRYKFPSPPPTTRRSSKTTPSNTPTKTTLRNAKSDENQASAHENILINSESTQGYQDSDFSPPILCIQRRRKIRPSYPTHAKHNRRYIRRSHPDITDDISSESSNSFQRPRIRSMTFKNSSIVTDVNRLESFRHLINKDSSRIKNTFNLGRNVENSSANDLNAHENLDPNKVEPSMTFQNSSVASDVYGTESYRLLMNKYPSRIKNTFNLGRIVESSPANDFNAHKKACNEVITSTDFDPNNVEPIKVTIDNESSSNVSLPTSPVLSIVENISVNKSFLSSLDLDDYPIDDKRKDDNIAEQITLNDLMTPNDVSMPLMQQDCDIEKTGHDERAYHYNLTITKNIPDVSESLLNRIDSINIQDPVSESLNTKLRNLLLESRKKLLVKKIVNNETREAEVTGKPKPKKATSKKRSSTPRKRQSIKKPTPKDTEPIIVEEHMESCSHRGGRQSCPPVILVSEHDACEPNENTPAETESEQFLTVKPTRGRKKKDIIKVKINKPKSKERNNSDKYNKDTNISDSGINDTISDIIQRTEGSVELIHNHSDTCLNAHECMGDSVVAVETCSNSIISLVSNSDQSDNTSPTAGDITRELFCGDAQDGSNMVKEFYFSEPKQVSSGSTTNYHTPPETHSTPNSLITDDLSFEIPENPVQNTGWYLFSDDELSNIDRNVRQEAPVFGAKLDQIFPVTCAVPNLSTITEMSRENGDSKKFSDNTNTREVFNSPNMFI